MKKEKLIWSFFFFLGFSWLGRKVYSMEWTESLFFVIEATHFLSTKEYELNIMNKLYCKEFNGFVPMVLPYGERKKYNIIEVETK